MFEKKKVTFEKRNADPSYFAETLCNEFPSLQGKEFSLWRLGCTNATNETKTSLIPLPSEINNAVALCDCEELNRSCLYIKPQVLYMYLLHKLFHSFIQAISIASLQVHYHSEALLI